MVNKRLKLLTKSHTTWKTPPYVCSSNDQEFLKEWRKEGALAGLWLLEKAKPRRLEAINPKQGTSVVTACTSVFM